MSIAVVLMIKNESESIARTIQSCNKSFINGIIVYDTGSTDDTIQIIQTESHVPVDVLYGTFEDFATSRNKCLDFANTKQYDFLLFLDANDELITSESFKLPDSTNDESVVAWMINIRWKIDVDKYIKYKNVKLVRAHVSELRWKGVVHEFLDTAGYKTDYISSDVEIYQDRTTCDNRKSQERWAIDRVLLEKELSRDPTNHRTLFYLAQTYDCLGEKKLAYDHYEMRANMAGGFDEEQFFSMVQCGKLANDVVDNVHLAIHWFTRACTHATVVHVARASDASAASAEGDAGDASDASVASVATAVSARSLPSLPISASEAGEAGDAEETSKTSESSSQSSAISVSSANDVPSEIDASVAPAAPSLSHVVLVSNRAEPLVALSRIFTKLKCFRLAHAYAKLACELEYPHYALLFVDTYCYDYLRWHQLGIVSWYAGQMADGYVGCIEAIKAKNQDIDKQNLSFYESLITSNKQLT